MTTFHLVVVALDPYTYESSWIIETAGRVLDSFVGADCRVAWLVAAGPDEARAFLGPWADKLLTFTDPERTVVSALGLTELPAFVHLNQALQVEGAAEGWRPEAWRAVADNLARAMSWSRPAIPTPGDPAPYAGTPAVR